MKKWEPGEHRPRGSIIQVVYPGECEIGSNQNALTTFPTHLTRGGWPQTCRMDKASKVRSHTCSNCKIWDGGTKGSWTELLFRCLEDSLNNGKRKDPPWRAIGGEEWDTSSKTRPGLPFHATLPCHASMPPFHATLPCHPWNCSPPPPELLPLAAYLKDQGCVTESSKTSASITILFPSSQGLLSSSPYSLEDSCLPFLLMAYG